MCFGTVNAQNTLDELGLGPTNTAQTAYSLRKLSTQYSGDALRVRRASDNAEALIGFDSNGIVSENSLARFQPGVPLLNMNSFTTRTGTISNTQANTGTVTVAVNKTGTLALSISSVNVTGTGTLFTTELSVGDVLYDSSNNLLGTIISISSNTALTLNANSPVNSSNIAYRNEDAVATGVGTNFTTDLVVGQQIFNLSGAYLGTVKSIASATEMKLRSYDATAQTSLGFRTASTTITGVGTSFTTELAVGNILVAGNRTLGIIQSIISNTQLTLSGLVGASVSGVAYRSGSSQVNFDNFYSGTSVFVARWFDQSGFGRDLQQIINASQPRIVLTGVPHKMNNRFVIRHGDGGGTFLLTEKRANWFDNTIYSLSKITAEVSLSPSNMNSVSTWGGQGPGSQVLHHGYRDNNTITLAHYGNDINFNALSTTDLEVHTSIYTAPGSRMYRNKSILGTSATTPGASLTTPGHLSLGLYRPTNTAYNGFFAEFLSFNAILNDAVRETVEENQLTYYSIDRSVWTGALNTEWTNPGNWQGAVPTSSTPTVVVIPNTPNKPVISSTVDARSITVETGSTLTITSSGNLRLNGILISPTAGIIASQGSIEFNQHQINITLLANVFQGNQVGSLRINSTNNVTIQNNLTINNQLRLSNGVLITNGDQTLTINGSIVNDFSNRLRGNSNLRLVLNCTTNSVLSMQQGGDTNMLRSLQVNSTSFEVSLNGNVQLVNEFLDIQSGTFKTNGFAINRTSAGGTLTIGASGKLNIGGTGTIPANFTTHSFAAGSTVEYSGSNQSVSLLNSSQNYSNLILSGTGIKTFTGITNVQNNTTILSGTKALLNGFTHNTIALFLDASSQISGSYGGTSSGADNINTSFFENGTGIFNVTSQTYTWVGNVSNDWNTAGNWLGGVVPSATINVIVPDVLSPNFDPVITTTAKASSIILNASAILTNNGSLNIYGNWTNSTATTSGNGNYNFYGSNKQITGSANNFGNLIIKNSASIVLANTGHTANNLTIEGTTSNTSFTHQGSASITISGNITLPQPTASATNSWNINAGQVIVNGNISFTGTDTNTARVQQIVLTAGSLRIDGNLNYSTVNNTSRIINTSAGSATIRLRGSLNLAGTNTLTAGTAGSTFVYEGTSAQTVNFFTSGGYHNLTLGNSVSTTLSNNITTGRVTGNLVFALGTVNNNGFNIAGNSNRIFNIQNGVVFNVTGTSSFPSGYGTINIEENTLVRYNSVSAQTIAAANYFDIEVTGNRGANNVTLANSGTIDIRNIITSSVTFSTGSYVTTGSTVRYSKGSGSQNVANFSYNNLSLANGAQKFAIGDIAVDGILNLDANPTANRGQLEMTIDYTNYATSRYSTDSNGNSISLPSNYDSNPLNLNSTSVRNNLNSYVLTMGASATTTGSGDVTGKIRRTSFANDVAYTFGNTNTRITFSGGGTLPSQMTVVSTIGDNGLHVDKSNAVKRLFQILRTGGAVPKLITLRLPYQDASLNGNSNESNLVLWDHHIPYGGPTPHEHGKTNFNTTQNWVELTGHGITYLATEGDVSFTKYWMISNKVSTTKEWLGAVSNNWDLVANWNGAVPTSSESVVISTSSPNALLANNSRSLGTIEIRNGVTVNTDAGATLTLTGGPAVNGGAGSWNNQGTFNAGTSTVVFTAANATLSGSTNFNNLTVNNGSTLTLQSDASIGIANTLTQNGVIDATTNSNTISFNGSNQNILIPTGGLGGYQNLIINQSSGNASLVSNTNVRGQLVLSQGNLNVGSNTLSMSGPYLSGNTNLLQTTSSSNLEFFNSSASNSSVNLPPITQINNLSINSPADIDYQLQNSLPITGNLTVTNGSLTLNAFTANRASSGGSISILNNSKINIGGTNGFPTNYTSKTISSTSTITYNGTAQTIDGTTQGVNYGTLVLSGGNKTFASNTSIAGNFDVDNGTNVTPPNLLTFNGSQAQAIEGLSYPNIRFEGNGAKSFTSNGQLNSNGQMTFGSGSGILDFDGSSNDVVFTFKSDASNTAIMGDSGNFELQGNVTTERYTKAKRAFRFFTSSVSSTTSINANWQEGVTNLAVGNSNNINPNPGFGTHITGAGGATNGFDVTATNNPSIFEYDNNSQAWTALTSTLTNNLTAGTPYRILVRGDRSPGLLLNGAAPFVTKLRARGTMVKSYTVNATVTGSGEKYIFVGNPYQSIVDLQTVLSSHSTNINANFAYFWDSNINTNGAYVTATYPSVDATRYLQPWQAVFVRTSSSSTTASVSIPESTKVLQATNETPFNVQDDQALLRIQLYSAQGFAANAREIDNALIRFSSFYSSGVDSFDATKFANPDEDISSMNGTSSLAVESRAWPTATDVLPLRINKYRGQNYVMTLTIGEIQGMTTYLVDQFLGINTPILPNQINQYSYSVNTSVASSVATDRFKIIFVAVPLSNEPTESLPQIIVYPNPSQGIVNISYPLAETAQIEVYSFLGSKLIEKTITNSNRATLDLENVVQEGVYILRIMVNNRSQTFKLIIKK